MFGLVCYFEFSAVECHSPYGACRFLPQLPPRPTPLRVIRKDCLFPTLPSDAWPFSTADPEGGRIPHVAVTPANQSDFERLLEILKGSRITGHLELAAQTLASEHSVYWGLCEHGAGSLVLTLAFRHYENGQWDGVRSFHPGRLKTRMKGAKNDHFLVSL